MNKAAIGLTVTALVFVVVAFVVLRVEPSAGPLLAIAPTADDGISAEQVFDAIEPAAPAAVSDERREQVRQLLRHLKPKQPESAIEVWVDEFCEMSDDEISFLVTQSGMLAGMSGRTVLSDSIPGGLGPVMETELNEHDVEAVQEERQSTIARRNCKNLMTIGHRGQVELTVVPADKTADPERIAIYRLSCGDVIVTGNRLHIALRTPGAVFFQLSDGRLTRNGKFTRLATGKLGLAGRGEAVALQDSPTVPADEFWSISEDGRVLVGGDSAKSLGKIRVVRVTQPEQLTSEDGVYFRTESSVISVEDVQLQAEALELSNVDVIRNQQLLP